MTFKALSYYIVSDVEKEILSLTEKTKKRVAFLVANSSDREWLKDILLEGRAFGAEPFKIWRHEDLYREALMEKSKGAGLVQIDPPDHWLLLNYLVKELIKSDAPLLPGVKQAGFVEILGGTIRELIREDLSSARLREALGDSLEEKDPSSLLCDLYKDYENALSERGLMDSAAISAETERVLQDESSLKWMRNWHIVFVGFYSFTHSQLRLLRTFVKAGLDLTLLSPATGMKGEYNSISQLKPKSHRKIVAPPIKTFRLVGGSVRQELEVLARNLVLWSGSIGPLSERGPFPGWGNVGITVSEQLLSLALEVFHRYEMPFRMAQGKKVSQTLLWETVRRTWDCYRDGWQPLSTAELLSSPWFEGDIEEKKLIEVSPRGLKSWRNYLTAVESEATLAALERSFSFAELLAKGATPGELLRGILNLITTEPDWRLVLSEVVDRRPDLDDMVLEVGAALQEVDRKIRRIDEVERDIGEAKEVKLAGGDALAFLSVWAESSQIWPPVARTDCAILYVGTPPVLAKHKVWAMTDCTARSWPGKLAESPLLDDARKGELHDMDLKGDQLDRTHLPLLSEKREQREVLFRRLMACAEELLIMTSSSMDGAGKVLPESPFIEKAFEDKWIEEVGRHERTPGNLLPSWGEPLVEKVEVHDPPKGIISSRPDRKRDPSSHLNSSEKSVRLSAIDEFASCPFRFKCSQILRLAPVDRPGYNPRLAGTACHKIWALAWKGYMEGAALTGLVDSLWEATLEETYRDLLFDRDLARRRDLLKDNMIGTALALEELEAQGLKEARLASYMEIPLPPLMVNGIKFSGIADRLDLLKDGTVLLWDYKSGLSTNYRSSLQLASYAITINSGLDEMPFDMTYTAGYGFIGQSDRAVTGVAIDGAKSIMGLSPRARTSLDDRVDKADAVIGAAAFAMKEGVFDVNYDSPLCRGCPYSGLCRIGEFNYKEEDEEDGQ